MLLTERAEMDVKHPQKIVAETSPNVRLSTIHNLADPLKVESWELLRTPEVRVVPPQPGPETLATRARAKDGRDKRSIYAHPRLR